jgi:hypothetical protein
MGACHRERKRKCCKSDPFHYCLLVMRPREAARFSSYLTAAYHVPSVF